MLIFVFIFLLFDSLAECHTQTSACRLMWESVRYRNRLKYSP
jgi:hypothetical protein